MSDKVVRNSIKPGDSDPDELLLRKLRARKAAYPALEKRTPSVVLQVETSGLAQLQVTFGADSVDSDNGFVYQLKYDP